MNKKISLSESIRNDIEKLKTLMEIDFNIGKPEMPEGTLFHGNIDLFLSLESDQDIVDSGKLGEWLDKVAEMFGYQLWSGGVGQYGGELQYEGKPDSDVKKIIEQVLEASDEIKQIVDEYIEDNQMNIVIGISPSIVMTNDQKDWYGNFADTDEMTQIMKNEISPAELLLKKQYDGEFPESD
jgi:hypothetical protein